MALIIILRFSLHFSSTYLKLRILIFHRLFFPFLVAQSINFYTYILPSVFISSPYSQTPQKGLNFTPLRSDPLKFPCSHFFFLFRCFFFSPLFLFPSLCTYNCPFATLLLHSSIFKRGWGEEINTNPKVNHNQC